MINEETIDTRINRLASFALVASHPADDQIFLPLTPLVPWIDSHIKALKGLGITHLLQLDLWRHLQTHIYVTIHDSMFQAISCPAKLRPRFWWQSGRLAGCAASASYLIACLVSPDIQPASGRHSLLYRIGEDCFAKFQLTHGRSPNHSRVPSPHFSLSFDWYCLGFSMCDPIVGYCDISLISLCPVPWRTSSTEDALVFYPMETVKKSNGAKPWSCQ
jgi:hypothetical protein